MNGQRKALIVANDTYKHTGLQKLRSPAADADGLRRVLADPEIGAFTVRVERNQPAHVINAKIEELFLKGKPDDVLLLHFSCHGLKSDSGELFFAAADTQPDLLGSTTVSADFVRKCMQQSPSRRIVLLLDCCYGGAFTRGVTVRASGDVNVLDSFPQERLGGGRGRAVITASGEREFAFEGTRLAEDNRRKRPSVFSAALIEGLRTGDADRNQDGLVSLDELYDYLFEKVREQNPRQTPKRVIELEGEFHLARSPKRSGPPAASGGSAASAGGAKPDTAGEGDLALKAGPASHIDFGLPRLRRQRLYSLISSVVLAIILTVGIVVINNVPPRSAPSIAMGWIIGISSTLVILDLIYYVYIRLWYARLTRLARSTYSD
jgi:hypothetical protein